ncbi:tRNA A64-2'-O-ribosylphosphate transferase [Malassezia brasiliensis]|uniref:tRNA A64-2'-O-ribosylphosphate transferase n=1 Tax=Malassezia brasiliensis TaxID=1821822 RepID=A0AAF0IR88_9BASI|nr:tRNA A64-2'-O-ribosylphosphate transferase [Malassezia brasiliensis]
MQAEREVLKALRRENKDLWSRLWSIEKFVNYVCDTYYPLPLIANMRCGAWYTPPDRLAATSYFKSTDGHMHQWEFSLKRANLHLVDILQPPASADGERNALTGCILVDSTRRGKRYPDALAKTVPIWCAVLNRASAARYHTPTAEVPLVVPTEAVSDSERSQIEAHLADWTEAFLASDYTIPRLDKPLCPLFAHPGSVPVIPPARAEQVHHIVLASVSSVDEVAGAYGATYVQGAGDDHEGWALGLTPDMFWQNRSKLLDPFLERTDRETLVRALVAHRISETHGKVPWLPQDVEDVIRIGTTRLVTAQRSIEHVFGPDERNAYALIVHCSKAAAESEDGDPRVLCLGIPEGKRGLNDFAHALPRAVEAVTQALVESDAGDRREVLICGADGYHVPGALLIAVLAASFDEQRALIPSLTERHVHRRSLSKDETRRRLQWVVGASEKICPSRAHLQRVNAALIGPHATVLNGR